MSLANHQHHLLDARCFINLRVILATWLACVSLLSPPYSTYFPNIPNILKRYKLLQLAFLFFHNFVYTRDFSFIYNYPHLTTIESTRGYHCFVLPPLEVISLLQEVVMEKGL